MFAYDRHKTGCQLDGCQRVSMCISVSRFPCSMRSKEIKAKRQNESSRALTFAVIGRGEVGEFPQQPSFLSVPAGDKLIVSAA